MNALDMQEIQVIHLSLKQQFIDKQTLRYLFKRGYSDQEVDPIITGVGKAKRKT